MKETKLSGVADLLWAASNKETNPEYDFFLQGDLKQMAEQKSQLEIWKFDIKQNDVYPCLKKADAKRALELILNFRIDGWWNYENKYIEYGFLTEREFIKELNKCHVKNERTEL